MKKVGWSDLRNDVPKYLLKMPLEVVFHGKVVAVMVSPEEYAKLKELKEKPKKEGWLSRLMKGK
jgi:hypothetical protein